MSSSSYLILIIFASFAFQTFQLGFIQPLSPLEPTFVNTELPSIYSFHFNLSSGLRSDAYLRVKFPNYTTLGTPTCLFDVNATSTTTNVDCIAISNSVYIEPKMALTAYDDIKATIFLTQDIPDSSGYTDLFELSTVSSTDSTTAIIFDINPGFGNMFWQPYSAIGRLFVQTLSIGTPSTANLQGAENSVSIHIRFNQASHAEHSRLVVTIDQPWTFGDVTITSDKSPLYSIAVAQNQPTNLYLATSIYNFTVQNPQILEIYFNETIVIGREFTLNIGGINNPLSISSGKVRFYSTDFLSNYVLESYDGITLSTAKNNLDITVGLASGIPFQGPVQLYKNTEQYVKISFLTETEISENSTITYSFAYDTAPVNGTLYIAPSLQDLNGGLINYTIDDENVITLSNLATIAAGSTITIQVKLLITKIWPKFYTVISISLDDTVIRYGQSTPIALVTNAESLVTFLGDSNNEAFVLEANSNSDITLNLTTTFKEVTNNATLYIYSTRFIDGPKNLDCTSSNSGVAFSACNFTNDGTFSKILIKTIPVATTLNINLPSLAITEASSHEEAIYEFYMRLDKDGSGEEVEDLMVFVFVRPARNVLSNFHQYHINNIGANTEDDYPSFIRMFGSQSALSSVRTSSDYSLVLTIYGFSGLSNYLDVANGESFPCGGSLPIECMYIEGSSSASSSYPLDWSRVVITLPDGIVNTPFNLYIPQFFGSNEAQTYEFILGTYNKNTRIYENLYIQNQYVANPNQDNSIFDKLNVTTDLYIDISGHQAGVLVKSSIPISFSSNMTFTTGTTNYGAATVLVTAWEFWNDQSVLSQPAVPLSIVAYDATVHLKYKTTSSDTAMNAVIWPMTGNGVQSSVFQALYVEMPYSLDIPDYVMYVTDTVGDVYAYNSVINTGRNALSTSTITDFDFDCNYMVQNSLNNYCTITFEPNAKIEVGTKVKIDFTNAFITISQCSLSYTASNGTVIQLTSDDFTCSSSLKEIQLAFTHDERLPVASYNFSFLGLDHQSGTDNSLTFNIYDDDFGYLIETSTFSYFLELVLGETMTLDNLFYDFSNLDAISNLRIKFTLPRAMYSNELLEFDIGADLQGNNKNTDRLAVFLTSTENTNQRINIFGALKNQILRIQFDEGVLLNAGSYLLNIDNLRTPSTHSTDKIKLRLRRETDDVFTLESNSTLFTAYPVLQLGGSAQLKILSSKFLCTGCPGEFIFNVILTETYLDQYTELYLHLPSFFLPALANNEDEPTCWFNKDPITCITETDYPYRLAMTNPPLALKPGDTFNLTIYGFIVPNAGISDEDQEDIFFAIYSPFKAGVYSEQTFLSLPSLSLIQSGLTPMFLYELNASNVTIKQNSDYSMRVNTSAAVVRGSQITFTFTDDYVNLRYLSSVPCQLNVITSTSNTTNYTNIACQVTGNTVQFNIIKDIPSSSSLQLVIQGIPNPITPMVVDANEFIVAAFKSDQTTMIAVSKDSLNSVNLLNITNPINNLLANSGSDIVLTRGTYSKDVVLGTGDGQRFVQDISINATYPGFVFLPSLMNFYVGDISSTFRVGCEQNVKVRTYPLNFSLNQDVAISNAYGDAFNFRVRVTDEPILIEIPETITVPLGGSSVPYEISLDQVPFRNMQILVQIANQYGGAFGIDQDYSSPAINFTLSRSIGYLCFFATSAMANHPQTLYVDLTLDGDNYEAYTLSRTQVKVVIDSSSINSASISGTKKSIGKTEASFKFTYSTPGMAFFQLSESCKSVQTLQLIKNMLRNNSFSDLEVTTDDCYQRYFTRVLDDNGTYYMLNVTGLTPETEYTMYVYFENQMKDSNSKNPLKFTFTTECNCGEFFFFINNF